MNGIARCKPAENVRKEISRVRKALVPGRIGQFIRFRKAKVTINRVIIEIAARDDMRATVGFEALG
jgi:hypothetical protein